MSITTLWLMEGDRVRRGKEIHFQFIEVRCFRRLHADFFIPKFFFNLLLKLTSLPSFPLFSYSYLDPVSRTSCQSSNNIEYCIKLSKLIVTTQNKCKANKLERSCILHAFLFFFSCCSVHKHLCPFLSTKTTLKLSYINH